MKYQIASLAVISKAYISVFMENNLPHLAMFCKIWGTGEMGISNFLSRERHFVNKGQEPS